MAPKKQSNGEAAGSPDLTLSESEAKLIASILKHSPASCKLKPNWEAVRQDVESASTESVNRRYLLMIQKRGWFKAEETSPNTPDAKKTPAARASSKKQKRATDNEENGEGAGEDSPTKKRKSDPKKKVKKQEAEVKQNDQELLAEASARDFELVVDADEI